jgi:hypothetical protein
MTAVGARFQARWISGRLPECARRIPQRIADPA